MRNSVRLHTRSRTTRCPSSGSEFRLDHLKERTQERNGLIPDGSPGCVLRGSIIVFFRVWCIRSWFQRRKLPARQASNKLPMRIEGVEIEIEIEIQIQTAHHVPSVFQRIQTLLSCTTGKTPYKLASTSIGYSDRPASCQRHIFPQCHLVSQEPTDVQPIYRHA